MDQVKGKGKHMATLTSHHQRKAALFFWLTQEDSNSIQCLCKAKNRDIYIWEYRQELQQRRVQWKQRTSVEWEVVSKPDDLLSVSGVISPFFVPGQLTFYSGIWLRVLCVRQYVFKLPVNQCNTVERNISQGNKIKQNASCNLYAKGEGSHKGNIVSLLPVSVKGEELETNKYADGK